MATTQIAVEAKQTKVDTSYNDKNARVMEMRLIAQNRNVSSITNPNDKRKEDIKAPFSEIVDINAEGNIDDLII